MTTPSLLHDAEFPGDARYVTLRKGWARARAKIADLEHARHALEADLADAREALARIEALARQTHGAPGGNAA